MVRKGDKFLCINEVNNVFGMPLFKKDEVYEVLYVDHEQVKTYVVLNHILYGNEFAEHELQWILENFKQL